MESQRVIAYVRVSVVGDRAKRGRFESPDLQREAIDGWVAARGMTVVREVRDLNRSGGTLTRPGLTEALEVVAAGEADGIVVARSDRASRRTLDGLGLIDELERRGGFIAAADGTIDTTDRVARMATTMMFAVGQHELDRYREQSAEVHRRAIVERGRHMGPAPFGFVRDGDGRLAVDEERAGAVRLIFERRAGGAGWTAIARELDDAGVRFVSGRKVSTGQLARIVRRRVYVGEASHGAWTKAGAHPAIVDEALFAAANRARPAVASAPFVGRAHPESPLRGLLRCSGCRYVLKRLPGERGKPPRWACRTVTADRNAGHSCGAPARLTGLEALEVEAIVVERFLELAEPVELEESDGPEVDVGRRVADAEALLDELSTLEVRRELGADRWSRLVSEARVALEEAQHVAAQDRVASRRDGSRVTVPAIWEAADERERGELLRGIVQAVMVDAGVGTVGERVHVLPVWDAVDVPRKGVHGFAARPWHPDAAAVAREDARRDAADVG